MWFPRRSSKRRPVRRHLRVETLEGRLTPATIFVTTRRGLTVRNGRSNDVPGGGGILVTGADLTLRGCVVIGNQTVFANGGGISGIDGDDPANVSLVRS